MDTSEQAGVEKGEGAAVFAFLDLKDPRVSGKCEWRVHVAARLEATSFRG